MILVDVEGVTARRPDRPLFEDLSVTVSTGDRLGVVGRNGAGKSTLLRVLAGVGEPEEGAVRRGRGVRIAFLDQHPTLPPGTVRGAVGSASGGGGWEAAAILDRLGMGDLGEADVSTLSGGQAKRVALARALLEEVDLLVLDEPTNHLDIDAIAWLEDRLAGLGGGLVLVTHDRHVLDRVTTRILELDRGKGYVHNDGYAGYLAARSERGEREVAVDAVRRNLARSELAWLRRGAPARTRKPKARIASATAIVEGRGPVAASTVDLELGGTTPRLGDRVIELVGVGHRFGDESTWLFRDLDLDLEPGGRLGIVGANGTGKSTLLDILAGRRSPAAGRVVTAPTVRIGYYDQVGVDLDLTQRVREAVAGSNGQPTWEQGRLMERFLFDADAQWAPIGTLSGGERRRLQLLLVLAGLPNVLLLDEPTNDLDLDTLRALEDYLEHWPGSLVVVSHDRALLERTVEDVLVLDGLGGARVAPAGYAEYEAERRRRRAAGGSARGTTPSVGPGSAGTRGGAAPGGGPGGGPVAGRPGGAGKARSASTLRRLVALAEREMAEASERRQRLQADLTAVGGDHNALAAAARALAEADVALALVEDRWLALTEELGA
jgi:ABC transport system ATP-binding/permease protein